MGGSSSEVLFCPVLAERVPETTVDEKWAALTCPVFQRPRSNWQGRQWERRDRLAQLYRIPVKTSIKPFNFCINKGILAWKKGTSVSNDC